MESRNRNFVTKNNWNRYITKADLEFGSAQKRNESYQDYNTRMIRHEFFGLKTYGLLGHIPEHFYISRDSEQNLALNVELLEDSIPLREFLGIDVNKPLPDYTEDEKKMIEAQLNKLDGIGVLTFMGMLLGDNDLFGVTLDNMRVREGIVYKIDASDVKLPFDDATTTDSADYTGALPSYFLPSLKKTNFFLPHNQAHLGMPFFNVIFSLLSEEQKQEGLRAMYAILSDDAGEKLSKIAMRLGYNPEPIITDLKTRAVAIIETFDPKRELATTPLQLNDIDQTVFVRDASHFHNSGEHIESGNSRPVISEKIFSEKQMRSQIAVEFQTILASLTSELHKKQELINSSSDPKRTIKLAALTKALGTIESLENAIGKILEQPKVSRADLQEMHSLLVQQFNFIINEFKLDSGQTGNINKLLRGFSDSFKQFTQKFGADVAYSSIGSIEKHQAIVTQLYGSFFREVAQDSLPTVKPTSHAEPKQEMENDNAFTLGRRT